MLIVLLVILIIALVAIIIIRKKKTLVGQDRKWFVSVFKNKNETARLRAQVS